MSLYRKLNALRSRKSPYFFWWMAVRPIVGFSLLGIFLATGGWTSPYVIPTWGGWLLSVLPDWYLILFPQMNFVQKRFGYGLFQPGQLLVLDMEGGNLLPGDGAMLYSTNCTSMEMCDNIYYAHMFELKKDQVGFESYPSQVVVNNEAIMLVLEQEEIGKYSFFPKRFDPYQKTPGRVKVLAKGNVFWANPQLLRELSKQ